jgi:transcription elongation factor GreA
MRVPIRKAGNLPQLRFDPRMSQEKYDELTAKLAHWKKTVHPRLAEEVRRSGQFGDFSENAEYQIAKGKLRGLNNRIDELQTLLNKAQIIKPNKNADRVELGHFVTIEVNGKQIRYQLLGSTQTNPTKGIISTHSPLGQALLNKQVNDTIFVTLPNKTISYKIVSIE